MIANILEPGPGYWYTARAAAPRTSRVWCVMSATQRFRLHHEFQWGMLGQRVQLGRLNLENIGV